MKFIVKPSDIYSSKEHVERALYANQSEIIGFRLPKEGDYYLTKGLINVYCVGDHNILRDVPLFITKRTDTRYAWWE